MFKKCNLLKFAISIAFLLCFGCASVQKDWESAKTENTVLSYEKFMEKHPNSKYEHIATEKIMELDWETTKVKNTTQAYEEFIFDYPSSPYTNIAKEKKLESHWKSAVSDNSILSYENFLSEYPGSKYQNIAEKRLENLRWIEAKTRNTMVAYKNFLEQEPNSSYVSDAKLHIVILAYNTAVKNNTIIAYEQASDAVQKYYPGFKFRDDIKSNLASLEKEKEKKKSLALKSAKRIKISAIQPLAFYSTPSNAPTLSDAFVNEFKEKVESTIRSCLSKVELKTVSSNEDLDLSAAFKFRYNIGGFVMPLTLSEDAYSIQINFTHSELGVVDKIFLGAPFFSENHSKSKLYDKNGAINIDRVCNDIGIKLLSVLKSRLELK